MASTRSMRAFKRWMKSQSIQHTDALRLLITPHQEVWVQALCDLREGDLIATIPKHACLTVKSSAAGPSIEDFGLQGHMALSLALMYENSLGQISPWFAYLHLMPPSNPYIPLLWSFHDIDSLLLGTELHKTVKEDKALVYEDWKRCILPFVESAPIELKPHDFDAEHYFAAKSLVSSRAFEIDDYYGFGMVPLADLFNHKTNAEDVHFTSVSCNSESDNDTCENTENQVDNDLDAQNASSDISPKSYLSDDDTCSSTTEVLEMILVRDVKAGAEVFNTYGSLGNAALLHRYGFTEADNPYDIVNIDLDLVLQWGSSVFSPRYTRSRVSFWRKLCPTESTEYFEVSYEGEPEVELLRLLFIICIPEQEFNSSRGICEISEMNKSALLTKSVRSGVLRVADMRERCYGSRSMQDDVEALGTCCPVTQKNLYHSLTLRLAERRILEKLRTYAASKR